MRYLVLYTLLIALPVVLKAQPATIRSRIIAMEYGERLYAEALLTPHRSADSGNIIVMMRIANDMLNFVRSTDANDIGGNYKADVAVSIELRDSVGVIRQRAQFRDVAYTTTFEETNNKNTYHYGWSEIVVGPGTYTITVELKAPKESSNRRYKLPTVSWKSRRNERMLTSPVFTAGSVGNNQSSFLPFIFNNNLPFSDADVSMVMCMSDSLPVTYDYKIEQLPWDSRDIRWWRVNEVNGTATSSGKEYPKISTNSYAKQVEFDLVPRSYSVASMSLLRIDIPVTSLVPARYMLTLVERGTNDSIKVNFQINWETMPFSLRTLSYAREILRYICPDDVIDDLSSGSDAESRQRLMEWWKAHDPSPATTYNEKLAEYYKRVDAAVSAFAGINEPDGAQTDRGRVYVLFGPPASAEKKLNSGKGSEVWTYTSGVKQTFVFEITDKGTYKLTSVSGTGKPE